MVPTANSPGVPTLQGVQATPLPRFKDEPGSMRVVVGFGSDSNDRLVGTVKLGRSRASDGAHQVVSTAAAATGWFVLEAPVWSNANQVGLTAEPIAVRIDRVAWVTSWADFQQAHGTVDEAAWS